MAKRVEGWKTEKGRVYDTEKDADREDAEEIWFGACEGLCDKTAFVTVWNVLKKNRPPRDGLRNALNLLDKKYDQSEEKQVKIESDIPKARRIKVPYYRLKNNGVYYVSEHEMMRSIKGREGVVVPFDDVEVWLTNSSMLKVLPVDFVAPPLTKLIREDFLCVKCTLENVPVGCLFVISGEPLEDVPGGYVKGKKKAGGDKYINNGLWVMREFKFKELTPGTPFWKVSDTPFIKTSSVGGFKEVGEKGPIGEEYFARDEEEAVRVHKPTPLEKEYNYERRRR